MKKITIIALLLVAFTVQAQESKIIGNWQLSTVTVNGKTETGLKAVFIFAEKGILKAARNATSNTIDAGTWKYNKKKKSIVMTSALDKDFNGEALVINVNDKELTYKKDGATLSFIKLEKMNSPVKIQVKMEKPILSFDREAMYDEEGNFNYEVEQSKLPWKIETIVNYLKGYHEVIYDVTNFPDDGEADTWVESEKIKYDEAAQSIDIRRYSYSQNDYIDMMEDPIWMNNLSEYDYDFNFFPNDNLDPYKVIGIEKIETKAGVFNCTVVEGFGNFDKKVKYWMINNQPGVFAKVIEIEDAPAPYGSTNVYILKEIK